VGYDDELRNRERCGVFATSWVTPMGNADEIKAQEFELKRIDSAAKIFETAVERQFKLATFGLAGNVGAIGASTLYLKDYRPKDASHNFSDATFWFYVGAIISAIVLGLSALVSEVVTHRLTAAIADGTPEGVQRVFFGQIASVKGLSVSLLVFAALYLFSTWCFFYGVYRLSLFVT
jgi:hypothetical protein